MREVYMKTQSKISTAQNFSAEGIPYISNLREWANKRVQEEDLEARQRNPLPLPPIKTYKIQGSNNNIYTLTVKGTHKSCSCPGYQFRGKCKHATLWTPAYGRL